MVPPRTGQPTHQRQRGAAVRAMLSGMARVLLTGADGYIGVRLGDHLLRAGFDVVGPRQRLPPGRLAVPQRRPAPGDAHQGHPRCGSWRISPGSTLWSTSARSPTTQSASSTSSVTYRINHDGTVRLAELAKQAGVERFVQMSSCSVYGVSGDRPSNEGDPVEPLTAYARCKVLVEEAVGALADDDVLADLPSQRHGVRRVAAAALRPRRQRPRRDGVPLPARSG